MLRLLCAALVVLTAAACGSPCTKKNGSVDGYCDGTAAANCRSTCADCVDEWIVQGCPGTCQVVAEKPAEGLLSHQDPHMDQPAKWAVCK